MTDSHDPAPHDADAVPRAKIVRARPWLSWIWLVPLAALVTVGVLVYQTQRERGPRITITFAAGHGLQPGDPVVYRGVRVGQVRTVRVEPRLTEVAVEAELRPEAELLTLSGTRYRIVRPEVSIRGVSGLETLFGPKYIEAELGDSDSPVPTDRFRGVEQGTPVTGPDAPGGLRITLLTPRRGSLGTGSPVSYRDIQIGQITEARLAEDARTVVLTAFVQPRYAPLVRSNSRFWNASGVGIEFGLMSGFSLRTESLESVLAGGVSLATPDRPGEPVRDGDAFTLQPKPETEWLEWSPAIDLGASAPSP